MEPVWAMLAAILAAITTLQVIGFGKYFISIFIIIKVNSFHKVFFKRIISKYGIVFGH